jgi:23S rRNA A1618 N6-methylase RlmF
MEKPNFLELSRRYPELRTCLHQPSSPGTAPEGPKRINWKDEHTQRTITKVTLKDQFGVNIELPSDRLCPPVPNRMSYILWLAKLVSLGSVSATAPSEPPKENDQIRIIDIGVGSSCIYPLLGHAKFGWSFYGSETDDESLKNACENVARNGISYQECIRLYKVEDSHELQEKIHKANYSITPLSISLEAGNRGPILSALLSDGSPYKDALYAELCSATAGAAGGTQTPDTPKLLFTACMTNPPFFSSHREANKMIRSENQGSGATTSSPSKHPHAHTPQQQNANEQVHDQVLLPPSYAHTAPHHRIGVQQDHQNQHQHQHQHQNGHALTLASTGRDTTEAPSRSECEDKTVRTRYLPPSAVCTGSHQEMITPGGEVAFVCAMVADSLVLRERYEIEHAHI